MDQPVANTQKPARTVSVWGILVVIILGIVTGLAGYYYPIGQAIPGEFCQLEHYGFPLPVQERLAKRAYTDTNPETGTTYTRPCIIGSSKDSDIAWVKWLANIAITAGSFALVGYLAQRWRWFWYLALPVVVIALMYVARIWYISTITVTT